MSYLPKKKEAGEDLYKIYCLIYPLICSFAFIFFNWRIITLQYCAGFCHTSTWISHRYAYVPSLPSPFPSHPSRLVQSRYLSSLNHTANSRWPSILHMVMYMFQCYSLNSSHALFPLLCPQVCSLSVSPLPLCRQVRHYHLFRFHIYELIYNICLSLTYFTL